jgi:hypothetical protein
VGEEVLRMVRAEIENAERVGEWGRVKEEEEEEVEGPEGVFWEIS